MPMHLLLTGSGGMLGRDVAAAATLAGHEVLPFTRAQLDVADAEAVRATVAAARPDAVINCAAWTDVDGAEDSEAAATAVNGAGAGHVAAAAAEACAHVVHVSSDYVFDGRGEAPYAENDPTGPLSAYGRSKLAGELAVAAAAPTRHAIVRSAWLFGVHGRNFVATMLGLGASRDEVRVVDDQIGCPTFTGHLAGALVTVAERRLTGVLHIAGGGRCSWFDLARAAFEDAGVACTALPCTTAEFPRPAPRPAWSVLASTRPDAPVLPPWREGLRAYLSTDRQEVAR